MKLTVDQGPNDWRRHFKRPKVSVDGVEVRHIREVDTDAGYVDRLATDDAGHFVHEDDEVKIERLHGVVEVAEAADGHD